MRLLLQCLLKRRCANDNRLGPSSCHHRKGGAARTVADDGTNTHLHERRIDGVVGISNHRVVVEAGPGRVVSDGTPTRGGAAGRDDRRPLRSTKTDDRPSAVADAPIGVASRLVSVGPADVPFDPRAFHRIGLPGSSSPADAQRDAAAPGPESNARTGRVHQRRCAHAVADAGPISGGGSVECRGSRRQSDRQYRQLLLRCPDPGSPSHRSADNRSLDFGEPGQEAV